MSLRFLLPLISLLGPFVQLRAQDRLLTIEEAFSPTLQPRGLAQFGWIPESNRIAWVANAGGVQKLVQYDAYNRTTDTVATLAILKQALGETGMNTAKFMGFPALNWIDPDKCWFVWENKLIQFIIPERRAEIRRVIPEGAAVTDIAPNTLNVAVQLNNNLSVITSEFTRRITDDGGNGIVYGEAAHRSEFGITEGLFWSPSGKQLAFYRQDERRVSNYPLLDINSRPGTHNLIKYPCAGDSSHTVSVGVYHADLQQVVYLKTEGPYDQYLTNITWSPDGKHIYVAIVNREQNKMRLVRYDALSGMPDRVLFEESNEKWVEPEHGPVFIPGDNGRFLWFSERDGWNHLYLYNSQGKLLNQVTVGKWIVTDVVGFSKNGETVFFTGTKDGPLERHLYSVRLNGGTPQRITRVQGTHAILPNYDLTLFADVYSNRETPRRYDVIQPDGEIRANIFSAANPVVNFRLGRTEIFPVLNGSTLLYSRAILPPDFDAKQRYPVVIYVYGGPHAQMITETWLGGANLWMHYMAQKGYIVFTLDNRGSANRGFDFESAIFRDLGTAELEDQMLGVRYLKQLPYVDTNRIGVHGWSFGGFMTTTMMTRQPETFKVGVAGGPVIDWKYYEIMYTERYMDRPQENKEGYNRSSLLNAAANLRGRLLMIHGTDDDVVLWQHSMLFVEQAVKQRNANLDYFIYPGHKHNVVGPDRVHLYKKVSQYFFDFL